ncbi:DUF4349 domain-containing protein [Luteimonas sp. e5]
MHMRFALPLLSALLLVACGRESAPESVTRDRAAAIEELPAAGAVPAVSADRELVSAVGEGAGEERRFVHTASARFEVDDVYAAAMKIEDAAAAHGGFVARNRISNPSIGNWQRNLGDGRRLTLQQYRRQAELQVRIPAARSQEFLRAIANDMRFLESREFSAHDVQFDLLRAQLAARRGQDAASGIDATDAQPGKVGERVDAARARADALAGRDEARVAQAELEDRIAFATLNLSLYQAPQLREVIEDSPRAALRAAGPGFATRMTWALKQGWLGLGEGVLLLITLWPLWLALVLVFAIVRALRRRRAPRVPPPPPVPPSA